MNAEDWSNENSYKPTIVKLDKYREQINWLMMFIMLNFLSEFW